MNLLHNLDLQNAKELKHCSSSTLPNIWTMAISTDLKYSENAQASALDVERMC